MADKQSYIILRDTQLPNGNLELFIKDHGPVTSIETIYHIDLKQQILCITVLLKNIIKHIKINA